MNYLLTICSDGIATPEKSAAMQEHLPAWVAETDESGVRLYGHPLAPVGTAKTVKVRDGETIVTDGPFAETKEIVAGFDLLDCADLDEAIEVAAKHPVAWFHSVEVRPLMNFGEDAASEPKLDLPDASVLAGPPPGRTRYMLLICVNGIPESDEEEAQIMRESQEWGEFVKELGVYVTGHPLAPADAATTVRVRDGETVISDGPFAETKEFIAGFTVLDTVTLDEALSIAAKQPIARYHRVEVRAFDGQGPES